MPDQLLVRKMRCNKKPSNYNFKANLHGMHIMSHKIEGKNMRRRK